MRLSRSVWDITLIIVIKNEKEITPDDQNYTRIIKKIAGYGGG